TCSMAVHAILFVGLIRITDAPIGASGIDLLPSVSAFQVSDSRDVSTPTGSVRRSRAGDGPPRPEWPRATRPVSQAGPGRMTPPLSEESQLPAAPLPLADLPRDGSPADATPDFPDGWSSHQAKGEAPDQAPVAAPSASREVSREPEGASAGTAQQHTEGR